ncbi:NAD(P)/FAD-dependent oxidoreductase [Rhodococcus olei]|uniref:NAD(P)/FAD-dependent oxidoreductase n=1 Tax=Rhodococcus olei TaxID=2161675 RepID=A0ABP8PKH6_9NOCA
MGAGFSGIGLGIELRKAGITDFAILEAADDVGGVWHHNRYPGVAVDIPSTTYSYSFEPNPYWSRLFAPGDELAAYANHCADKYGVSPHVHPRTRVEAARYDGRNHRWVVETSRGILTARFLVSAVGPLDQPKYPDIPGLGTFDGPTVHTARWDPHVALAGKRIGVIGTGASSLQLIPEIAPAAERLTVFQRTPIWVIPKPNTDISPRMRELFAHAPVTQRVLRAVTSLLAEFVMTVGIAYHMRVPLFVRSMERTCLRHLRKQVADPEVRAKLTPAYALGCKRPSFSNTYLPAFDRANVELVTERILRVTTEGIVTAVADTAAGTVTETHRELDVLVLATGFKTMQLGVVPPFPVRGTAGVDAGQWWDEHGYQTYEGISTPLLPNFWLMNGPWSAAGPSWFSVIESGSRHIARCLNEARRRGATQVVVRQSAHDAYMRSMRAKARHTAFAQPSCIDSNSYYFDRRGEAPFVRPVSGPGLRRASRTFDLDHYEYTRSEPASSTTSRYTGRTRASNLWFQTLSPGTACND